MTAEILNLARIKASIADAEPVAAILTGASDVQIGTPGQKRGGIMPGEWTPNRLGLPDDLPVQLLGVSGEVYYFLDPIGQIRAMTKFGKEDLLKLFCGHADYLAWAWPRRKANGDIDGYAAEQASARLIHACAAIGPMNIADRERGRGCWTGAQGQIVVHCGTKIVVGGPDSRAQRVPPGVIDRNVYPTADPLAQPYPLGEDLPYDPSKILKNYLRMWAWQRPDIDPHLMLGWIGAAFLGGALKWRPMVFVTGDKATGKSTLQALVRGVFGDWLISAADTTAAGLYQRVGLDSRPISVDELESEADVRKQKAVLKLARLAASGDVFLRGGDRHQGTKFNARSAFLFSSINAPPLEPQDLSRMALLRLQRLPAGAQAPLLEPSGLEVLGRLVLRRLIEEWPRFEATFAAYAAELARGGMDGRGQDQFGTLLTCADLICHNGWPEAGTAELDARLTHPCEADGELRRWAELLAVATLHEYEDMSENWKLCLGHLLSVKIDGYKGGSKNSVGAILERLRDDREPDYNLDTANANLADAGLKLVRVQADGRRGLWLAIQNQSVQVRQLFEGSKFCGDIGAGVWASALRQAPTHLGERLFWTTANVRVNGWQAKSTLISVAALYDTGGLMGDPIE